MTADPADPGPADPAAPGPADPAAPGPADPAGPAGRVTAAPGPAPGRTRPSTRPSTLEQSARLAGRHLWAERRLFEILGGWVTTVPEAEAKLLLDRHSHHCAWRARQWYERLPVLADVDRHALAASPDPVLGPAFDLMAATTGTAARLAAAYRFALPRLWAAYARHRVVAGPVADGSTQRILGIVAPDLAADWQEGEGLLQKLLTSRQAVEQAAGRVTELELVLVGA